MRRNTEKVLKALEKGKACKSASSIWTDGANVYSYRTVLVTQEAGYFFVNRTKYSPTTSRQQSGLREAMAGVPRVVYVEDVPRGYCGNLSAFADPALTSVIFA